MKSISPLQLDDLILGQYVGDPNGTGEATQGYLDDPTVPKDSITPTFAMAKFDIRNERWEGVPFIIKCGKGIYRNHCIISKIVRKLEKLYDFNLYQP